MFHFDPQAKNYNLITFVILIIKQCDDIITY